MKDWLVVVALFIVLGILTTTGTLYARDAEREARTVTKQLEAINITSQNRCIIQVILSYPAPITKEQFDVVLADYDACIKRETAAR